MLRNNKTTSNEVFNLQITVKEEEENNDKNGGIDNKLEALSDKNNNNELLHKKAKTVKKKLELDSVKEAFTQSKGEKKSAGVELTQKMRSWHEHCEKE